MCTELDRSSKFFLPQFSEAFFLLHLLSECFPYLRMLTKNAASLANSDSGARTAFSYEVESLKYHA